MSQLGHSGNSQDWKIMIKAFVAFVPFYMLFIWIGGIYAVLSLRSWELGLPPESLFNMKYMAFWLHIQNFIKRYKHLPRNLQNTRSSQ